MAHTHHHHHHHHHHVDSEEPLDAANQALADALRVFFRLLKIFMMLLVVLYCFSGLQCIEEDQEAVVLRFGKLLDGVRGPGLSVALPSPIDETLVFPTKAHTQFDLRSHVPYDRPGTPTKSLGAERYGGLDPTLDGALLTADRGLVHILWSGTYRVTNLRDFVLNVGDQKDEKVERLISGIMENVAIAVVSRYSAEEVTRAGSSDIAALVKTGVNEQLSELQTGLELVALDIPESSVPGQTVSAFMDVTKAENDKQAEERKAKQKANEILNGIAGAAHEQFIERLDERDAAIARGDSEKVAEIEAKIEDMLENDMAGIAGSAIRRARSFYTQVIQEVKGDVDEYNAVLDEYLTNRDLFVARMWESARREMLTTPEVIKHFVEGDELRIHVGEDPKQREIDDTKALQDEAEKRKFDRPATVHSVTD